MLRRSLEQVILDAMLFAHDEQLAGYPATAEEDEAAAADEQLPWCEALVLVSHQCICSTAACSSTASHKQ